MYFADKLYFYWFLNTHQKKHCFLYMFSINTTANHVINNILAQGKLN